MEASRSKLTRTEHAFEFAQRQVRSLVEREPGLYPLYTRDGKWRHSGQLWTAWGDGFLPGMMWIFYDETGDQDWRGLAESYSRGVEHCKGHPEGSALRFMLSHCPHRQWALGANRSEPPPRSP